MRIRALLGLILILTVADLLHAQPERRRHPRPDDEVAQAETPPADASPDARPDHKGKDDKDQPELDPKEPIVTEHTATIGGTEIHYTATAGMLPLMDDKGKVRAKMFYVAYTRHDAAAGDDEHPAADPARPITFAFNGGPGSSSVWLHLGALGPKRVQLGPEGEQPRPPGSLADNHESWLDLTDLVFVDPVSTGFSRAEDGVNPHEFHGLDEDIQAMGDFIRLYITRSNRWMSPKFLVGESYGTTRAAGLSLDLLSRLGIDLNGIILVSPVLQFQTISFDLGNDETYRLYLPGYTATAFYHGKLSGPLANNLDDAVAQSIAFADNEYLVALAKGDALSDAERHTVAKRLSELMGVSEQFILRSDLRVSLSSFQKELLRDESRTIGRFDSRYEGMDRLDVGGRPDYDPSYSAVAGVFTAGLNQYLRNDLGYESDREYEILTGNVHPWRMDANNRYVNVAERLRSTMTQNPDLRVMVASGYFDLATPFHAATYTIQHLGLDPSLQGNIRQTLYHAGHMMYVRDEDRTKLKNDAAAFYHDALSD